MKNQKPNFCLIIIIFLLLLRENYSKRYSFQESQIRKERRKIQAINETDFGVFDNCRKRCYDFARNNLLRDEVIPASSEHTTFRGYFSDLTMFYATKDLMRYVYLCRFNEVYLRKNIIYQNPTICKSYGGITQAEGCDTTKIFVCSSCYYAHKCEMLCDKNSDRPFHNCSRTITSIQFPDLKNEYRIFASSFVERCWDGGSSIEYQDQQTKQMKSHHYSLVETWLK